MPNPLSREAKWWFATFMVATSLVAYGKLAFQNPSDDPTYPAFSFSFKNQAVESPWEQVLKAQRHCVESLLIRQVPRREDGDAVQFEEACIGERVLRLEDAGGTLLPLQKTVAEKWKTYKLQLKYYYLGCLFYLLSLIPWTHAKWMGLRARFGKPLRRLWRRGSDVLKKMSS